LKIDLIFNGSTDGWDDYVYSNPASTNYHLFGWKEIIEKSFGHKTFYLASRNAAGKINGVLPLVHMKSLFFGSFLVSVPFFNYGGLLCDDRPTELTLLEEAGKILTSTGSSFIELRHTSYHELGLITKKHKVGMFLDLDKDAASQWDGFDAKTRNQIRKAQKSGLEIKTGHLDLLDDFYDTFSKNMHDLGTPVYSKNFFRTILQKFPDVTQIFSVMLQNKTIASGISISYRDTIEMPWASSIIKYRPLCPNDLLYWEAIKYSIEKKFAKFDFGRSSLETGSYKFKEQWGAKSTQLYWQYLTKKGAPVPELNPSNPKYRMAIKLWRILPVWFTNIAGPKIVKYIP